MSRFYLLALVLVAVLLLLLALGVGMDPAGPPIPDARGAGG